MSEFEIQSRYVCGVRISLFPSSTMATVQFKLSKQGSLTRRVNFSTRPDWPTLSAKIATLFNIPNDNVGVSYVDADGDEITLSTDEELSDYYKTITSFPTPTIKFTVSDLRSLGNTQAPPNPKVPQTTAPQPSPFRNTFGGPESFPLVFEVDDEWQNLPMNLGSLFLPKEGSESPHAFVELLESDPSHSRHSPDPSSRDGDTPHIRLPSPEPLPSTLEKGKERAREDMQPKVEDDSDNDVSSTESIIGNEAPSKPPVHVFDVSDTDIFGQSAKSFTQSGVAAQAQSTPVLSEMTLKNIGPAHTQEPVSPMPDDPPLPTVDPNAALPSLTHDVATLLTTFSDVVSSHPELLEGIRHIVSNTADGTYWAAHRAAISRAAENIHRTATAEAGRTIEEIRRTAEEEAGTRVAEALGTVFRTFAVNVPGNRHATPGNTNDDQAPSAGEQPRTPSAHSHFPSPPIPPLHGGDRHSAWFNLPYHRRPGPFWGAYPPPPPPPPPPPIAVPPFLHAPRSWPRPPPHRFWGRDGFDLNESVREAKESPVESRAHDNSTTGVVPVPPTPFSEIPPSSTTQVPRSDFDGNLSPEQLRVDLERAKTEYKVRKERYRQARAIRKMSEHRHKDKHETSIER
ncbi:hypothetical protein J3A83DRAFT_3237318 [Scleroderma citrinum]